MKTLYTEISGQELVTEPIITGQVIQVTNGLQPLYLDYKGTRREITSLVDVVDKITERHVLTGDPEKLLFVRNMQEFYRWSEFEWNNVQVDLVFLRLFPEAGGVSSVNSKTGDVTLTKGDIGLGNVDNIQQATKAEFNTHNGDNTRHITGGERTTWNNAAGAIGGMSGQISNLDIRVTSLEQSGGSGIRIESDDWMPSPIDPNSIGGSYVNFSISEQCRYHIIGNRLFFSASFLVNTLQSNFEIIDFEVYGLPEVPIQREIFQGIAFPEFSVGKPTFALLIGIVDGGILYVTAPCDINNYHILIQGSFEFDPVGMKKT